MIPGTRIDASGYDAGKKIKGKKRHLSVDTLGLMVGFVVTLGDIQDRNVAAPLLKVVRKMFPSLARAIADGGYQGKATADEVRAEAKIPLEIVKRSDMAKGFVVLPKRWIVERTFGWLGRCRRLAKDFENLSRSHAAFIILAMIRLMLRRIVRLNACRTDFKIEQNITLLSADPVATLALPNLTRSHTVLQGVSWRTCGVLLTSAF